MKGGRPKLQYKSRPCAPVKSW